MKLARSRRLTSMSVYSVDPCSFLTSETSSYRLVERVDESVDHGCSKLA